MKWPSAEHLRASEEIARKIRDLRGRAGLTQAQLAKLVGTTASVICRLEDADYEGHSLAMLRRIAAALNRRVEVRFLPIRKSAQERESLVMADSGVMREVESWVRDKWLTDHFAGTHRFMPQRVRLDAGGCFDFDAVSDDRSVAVCVCTSAGVTSGGKKGTSHLHKIRSDILFLTMAQDVKHRLVVLTDRLMWDLCSEEVGKGRLPRNVEILLAEPPADLQARLTQARRVAAAEMDGPART